VRPARLFIVLFACAGVYRPIVLRTVEPEGQDPTLFTPRRDACRWEPEGPWWFGSGPNASQAFFEKNIDALRANTGFLGAGIRGPNDAPVIHLEVPLCAQTKAALHERLASLVKEGRVGFQVTPVGLAGPRCEAPCAPQPYDREAYHRDRPRGLIDELPNGEKENCNFDGECVASQSCDPWTTVTGAQILLYYTNLRHALCGCVEHHCRWFVQ
jgi:hypothetical protein